MPLINLEPSADGTHNNWDLVLGASKWEACKLPYDADTTYIKETSPGATKQSFVMDDMPAGTAQIDSHDLKIRVRDNTGDADHCHFRSFTKIAGDEEASADHGESPNTYTTYLKVFANNPTAGTGWTVAQVNACELGLEVTSWDPAGSLYCTALWSMTVYQPESDGAPWLLMQWLPPILAVASHALMKSEIVQILSRLKIQPATDQDFAWIRAALQRRPSWHFQGISGL